MSSMSLLSDAVSFRMWDMSANNRNNAGTMPDVAAFLRPAAVRYKQIMTQKDRKDLWGDKRISGAWDRVKLWDKNNNYGT